MVESERGRLDEARRLLNDSPSEADLRDLAVVALALAEAELDRAENGLEQA